MVRIDGILPDTCAWIDFINGRGTPLAIALEQLLVHGEVFTCGVVKYELVQRVRTRDDERMLLNALGAVTHLEMTESLWIGAGRLSASLRKKGVTLPLSDIVVAVIALEHNLSVLTVDRHFDHIAGLQVVAG
jgi:predicted nucleic acid-binding protein